MIFQNSIVRGLGALLVLASLQPNTSQATEQLKGPIKLVVPFAAGGSVDAIARIVASGLEETSGQRVVVENRTGAEGSIAVQYVVRSAADGKTLLVGTTTQLLWVPLSRKEPPYDPVTALKPIGMLGESACFLYVNASIPVNSVAELVAFAKANPDKLNYAYGNSTGNIAAAQLIQKAQIKMNAVPYNGEAQAITDLLGNRVQVMFATTVSVLEQVKEGRVKALAVVGSARSPLAPSVPTFAESGMSAVDLSPWVAVFAPAATSSDLTDALSSTLVKALTTSAVETKLAGVGLTVRPMPAREMVTFVPNELKKWDGIITRAGIVKD